MRIPQEQASEIRFNLNGFRSSPAPADPAKFRSGVNLFFGKRAAAAATHANVLLPGKARRDIAPPNDKQGQ